MATTSLSDLAGCYVLLWSPRHRLYQVEKFSAMMDRNWIVFHSQQKSCPDWIVVAVAETAEGADDMQMLMDQRLSDQHRKVTDEDIEAERAAHDAELKAIQAGKPLKPQWVSNK